MINVKRKPQNGNNMALLIFCVHLIVFPHYSLNCNHNMHKQHTGNRWVSVPCTSTRIPVSTVVLRSRLSTYPGGRVAKASSVGANKVNGPGPV